MIHSILDWEKEENIYQKDYTRTSVFRDLHLDEIMEVMTKEGESTLIREKFGHPLRDKKAIEYRQEIMRDFEDHHFREKTVSFIEMLKDTKLCIQRMKREDKKVLSLMEDSEVLYLAGRYCETLEELENYMKSKVQSQGLKRFAEEVMEYIEGDGFQSLKNEIQQLYSKLEEIRFCMLIKDGQFHIRPYEEEKYIDEEIYRIFSRFNIGKEEDSNNNQILDRNARHIDEAILNLLSHWYGNVFDELKKFGKRNIDFINEELLQFAEEAEFYIRWQNLSWELQNQGLDFCYPQITEKYKGTGCRDGFDLALALKLSNRNKKIVTNSFYMEENEKKIVITGPNQGGKTTYARCLGQIFYLSSIGCSVPGKEVHTWLYDGLYTHFEKDEAKAKGHGKLQDDIERLWEIMEKVNENSIVIINEIYASTTLEDATYLGKKMMEELSNKGCFVVCVTFIDELAKFDKSTVSMMSTVNSENGERYFKIVRKPPDGLAYAMTLANKYELDYAALKRRLNYGDTSAV